MSQIVVTSQDDLVQLINKAVESTIRQLFPHTDSTLPQKKETKLLKVDEAAKFLRRSESTIWNWKKAGRIPFKRISRSVYFDQAELEKFMVANA